MSPEAVTMAVARRLVLRRGELRLSLLQLSERCGVSLQQVHRYETGANVLSAPMLWRLSRCLDVPVGYFFQDLEAEDPAA